MFSFVQKSSSLLTLVTAFSLAISRVEAQATSVPDCAQGCVSASSDAIGCDENDTRCLCRSPIFISSVLQCSSQACSPENQAATSQVLGDLCSVSTITSGFPGTSTGTFSGSKSDTSDSGSAPASSPSVITTTLPGGGTTIFTQTATLISPPISLSSLPHTGIPTVSRTRTSEGSSAATSTSPGTSAASSISIPPLSSATSPSIVLTSMTVTSSNEVSKAPPASTSSTNSAMSIRSSSRTLVDFCGLIGLVLVLALSGGAFVIV